MGNSISPLRRQQAIDFDSRTSGMSVEEFCAQVGISRASFYRIRRRAVKPRVLWRLVYLVPVVAGCDCSWRWRSGAQAASCSAGVRMPTAECGRMVPVPVHPLGGGEHGQRQCPPKGPGYGSARPCTRSSEPRPE